MRFHPSEIISFLENTEEGMNRIKRARPDVIPVFHIMNATGNEKLDVTIFEVIDVHGDIVKINDFNGCPKNIDINKMKEVFVCPNYKETYCFYSQLPVAISNIINEMDKPVLTKEQRLKELAKRIEEMK